MAVRPPIRLPRQWSRHVESGILHAIALASVVVSFARGHAAGRRRSQAKLEQAEAEIGLLREDLSIKDGRWKQCLLVPMSLAAMRRELSLYAIWYNT